MKKCYFTAAVLIGFSATAQVPNAGFEESTDGLTLKNWGAYYPIPVSIDANTGETTSDAITFQNGIGFSYPAANCWGGSTGLWSMALTNAFNATQNTVIPGKVELFDDSASDVDTGWNAGVPLAPGARWSSSGLTTCFLPMAAMLPVRGWNCLTPAGTAWHTRIFC